MDPNQFALWIHGAFGANLSDRTKSAGEASMPAKRRVRQLTIVLALVALPATADRRPRSAAATAPWPGSRSPST
jgi:hypothetical protein